MEMVLYVLLGFLAGFFSSWFISARRYAALMHLQQETLKESIALQEKWNAQNLHIKKYELNEEKQKQENLELQKTVSNLQALCSTHEKEKALLMQQLDFFRMNAEEIRKNSKTEFENLAQQILDIKTKAMNENAEKNINSLLNPLKEQILGFEKSISEKYSNESKERHTLKSEIEKLVNLNEKMTHETQSLTLALRGDSKVQGDWGELVLERILESSGLRDGHEYTLQKSLENAEGDRLRPDAVIQLPENKHIIVDAKVSLKAYDLFRSGKEENLKNKSLSDHIKSIEKHVEDLAGRHYEKLKGIQSPEFVFMFIPIEPAYVLAMQTDPDLLPRAWKKGVAIVTATTLLTSLKTVASIWRLEKQNKNALEIAQEAAKLYDKFVGFLDDFEKVGKALDLGQKQYGDALGKLKEGPGNVFRKIEKLRELGAAPQKRIRPDLLE